MGPWRNAIVEDDAGAWKILEQSRRIAVLGIKPEDHAARPAHYVPAFLQRSGWDIVPVPVYYPEVTEILGQKVYRRLSDIPATVDLVNVFRRGEDIDQHVEDILAKRPRAVWFQLGIRNDRAAERLARAGIQVVQDRCIMVDHRMVR